MKKELAKLKGMTLLEMLLVIVISISILIIFINFMTQKTDEIRRDRLVQQTEQVINAAQAYYVTNGQWPPNGISDLQANGYLPSLFVNPWGNSFTIKSDVAHGMIAVYSKVADSISAYIVAGSLPLAYATDSSVPNQSASCTSPSSTTCVNVVALGPLPGQNLNNSNSVNFASIYHNGACVPVPVCPTNMTPEIYVAVASVNGLNDPVTCTDTKDPSTCSGNIHTLTSYTAYAMPAAQITTSAGLGPGACDGSGAAVCYASPPSSGTDTSTTVSPGTYWRVCLKVNTEIGPVSLPGSYTTTPALGAIVGTIFAMTRCVPSNVVGAGGFQENTGSSFNVYSP